VGHGVDYVYSDRVFFFILEVCKDFILWELEEVGVHRIPAVS